VETWTKFDRATDYQPTISKQQFDVVGDRISAGGMSCPSLIREDFRLLHLDTFVMAQGFQAANRPCDILLNQSKMRLHGTSKAIINFVTGAG
jgi:hypothetical protein